MGLIKSRSCLAFNQISGEREKDPIVVPATNAFDRLLRHNNSQAALTTKNSIIVTTSVRYFCI